MTLNKTPPSSSLVLIIASIILSGCTHYASGYDGWTAKQVEKIKLDAKERYLKLQNEDGQIFGVNYLKFNNATYEIPIEDVDAKILSECESFPFVKYRIVGSVALKTSVCLNEKNEVNRIVLDYAGKNHSDIKEVVDMIQDELKNKYGRPITPTLENKFMKKEEYKSIYFSDSPSQRDLLHYNSILISDYITSASTDWTDDKNPKGIRYSRFLLDIKLRDYSSIQKDAATRRAARVKTMLNSSE